MVTLTSENVLPLGRCGKRKKPTDLERYAQLPHWVNFASIDLKRIREREREREKEREREREGEVERDREKEREREGHTERERRIE